MVPSPGEYVVHPVLGRVEVIEVTPVFAVVRLPNGYTDEVFLEDTQKSVIPQQSSYKQKSIKVPRGLSVEVACEVCGTTKQLSASTYARSRTKLFFCGREHTGIYMSRQRVLDKHS